MLNFTNPFRVTEAPTHFTADRRKRHKHIIVTGALSIFLCLVGLVYTPFIVHIARNEAPLTHQTLFQLWDFTRMEFSNRWMEPHKAMLAPGFIPRSLRFFKGNDANELAALLIYVGIGMLFGIAGMLRNLTQPYSKLVKKADASWATEETLRLMEAKDQIGVKKGFLMALGRWDGGYRDGQMVQMIETLSALCLAPPGTGKTAGLVIPTLVSCDEVSFIVNDPKPELFEATGAYRAKVGVVHKLDWSATNDIVYKPVLRDGVPVLDAAGEPVMVIDPERSVIYPSFNPLDPKVLPGYGPQRDTYIDAIAKSLIAESKGGDSYFTDKGRAALTGFIHCLVATVNDAKDYSDVTPEWHGMEASIPMLIDWIANALFEASGDAEIDETFLGPEDEMVQAEKPEDPMGAWIRKIAEKVKPPKTGYRVGCSDRAFKELASLISMADKERSGIMGTMDQAFLPFKNAAVKERTSTSSFAPDDLRGYFKPEIEARTKLDPLDSDYLDPTGATYKLLYKDKANWLPVTLYVCVNQAEAAAFANITALLFEVLSRTFLSYKPNDWNHRTGRFLGPFPICFVMDEFAKLPKIDAVLTGPDLGRSMKTSYMLVAQDYSQIEKTYGKELVRTINSTCSVKYILNQNESETKKMIVDMVGKTTIMRQSESNTKGIGKGVNAFQYNASETAEEVDFLRDGDIMGMEDGTHLVLAQGFNNRPMKLKTALWFRDPSMMDKVRSRGSGPIADQLLPPHVRDAELARLAQRMQTKVVNNLEIVEAQRAKAFEFCGEELDHDA